MFEFLRPASVRARGKALRSVIAAGVLLVGCTAAAVHAAEPDDSLFMIVDRAFPAEDPEMFVQDEFIVVLKLQAAPAVKGQADQTARQADPLASMAATIERAGAVAFQRQFPEAEPQPAGSPLPDLTGHYKVQIPEGADLDAAMAEFAADPAVDHVEKIGVHYLHVEPNDPYYRESPSPTFPYDQWHYWNTHSIDAELAWDIETGDPSVIVAVLDSGVRYFHLDLGGNNAAWGPGNPQTNGNIFVNPGEIPGNGVDDDGNGFIDDTIGYDFVSSTSASGCSCLDSDCGTSDNNPDDHNGHGTHVAGTVAAITNNNRQVAGVAGGFSDGTTTGAGNGSRILPLRIGWHASCFGSVTGVVRMDYAASAMNYVATLVDRGYNVTAVNCSWGSSNSGGIDAAVNALLARGVMVIKAAGNSNSSTADFLGGKAGVMNVAATDINGNGASFTNHGSWVDLAAPGVDILSTYRNPDDTNQANHYIALLSGTSMSAPHACGVAALLESCNPALTGTDKFNLMVANVDPYTDSRNLGSGILNVFEAMAAAGCAGGGGCQDSSECDDGLFCNGAETCVAGSCQSGTAPNCSDGVACITDSCNETTDSCDHTPSNAACDDGLFCNGAETCSATLGCQAGADPCAGEPCNESTDSCGAGAAIWMSFIDSASVPGVGTVQNEDIVAYDTGAGTWSLIFDGSDVGLGSYTIGGMAVMPDGDILLSFTANATISGLIGGPNGNSVEDSDVVRFTPTSLGANTAGSFSFYFDGSDVALSATSETIDALALTSDGRLVVSTTGNFSAGGASGVDEDLFVFNATSLGSVTSGSFQLYFDGSDVGLSNSSSEDVDGAGFASDGRLVLSTEGNFSVSGASGADEDVFEFTPTSLGSNTAGSYSMLLDLSTLGIATSEDVGSVEILD